MGDLINSILEVGLQQFVIQFSCQKSIPDKSTKNIMTKKNLEDNTYTGNPIKAKDNTTT